MAKIMSVINITPNSFYAPSRADGVEDVIARIAKMRLAGASIIDLGAVSTRPGAPDVPVEEEWARLKPALEAIVAKAEEKGQDWREHFGVQISIDTTSAEIVRRAYEIIGSFMVNDISAGEDDPDMLPTVAELALPYVAMHKRGNPRTMDSMVEYGDVVEDVIQYFREFGAKAAAMGIEDWILDPGFGFAKTKEQNLEMLHRLPEFKVLGRPVLVGIANKRMCQGNDGIDHTAELEALAESLGADIIRKHIII